MCFKCSGQWKDFLSPIEEDLPKKKKSSDSLALTGTLESQHTLLYCWSPAALYVFSTEQVREDGKKRCLHLRSAFCDQPWATAPLIYDVSSSCCKQQHGLVRKPPYPHFSLPTPFGTDLAFPSSLITPFSDLHLLFQSWFPGPFFISPAISSFHKTCRCF